MSQTREYFWGAELSEKNKEVVWDPELEDDEDDDIDNTGFSHCLFLKQAVLGIKAKVGERNIIEVQAEDFDGKSVTQPLFSLKLGLNESTTLDVGLQPPMTLRLASGSGPVFLSGQHALELTEDDLLDDDEAEESPIMKGPVSLKPLAKKRSASANEGPAKKAKIDSSNAKKNKDDEEDDDDSEDDEDFKVDMGDDSDDNLEDDSEEDEEDDDDDEEDMEENSPEKKTKKESKVNGAGPTKKEKADGKEKDKKEPTMDEIKKMISQSPTKPKKQGKFLNYIKNMHKVNDKQVQSELWTWYKKNVMNTKE